MKNRHGEKRKNEKQNFKILINQKNFHSNGTICSFDHKEGKQQIRGFGVGLCIFLHLTLSSGALLEASWSCMTSAV